MFQVGDLEICSTETRCLWYLCCHVKLKSLFLCFEFQLAPLRQQAGCKTGSQIPFMRPCRNACGSFLASIHQLRSIHTAHCDALRKLKTGVFTLEAVL